MDRLLSLEAFVRVADAQSFAAAARQLGVSKSVVTTRVHQLETLVQAALFHRTTRVVRLSDAGEAYYPLCAELVRRTNDLVDAMKVSSGAPSGLLRVHALPGFALSHFGEALRGFQDRYPEIALDLVVSDTLVDPVREGFDVVLQIFEPVSDALVARKLCSWRPVFCASPKYLEAHGTPQTPKDLTRHRLGLYSRYPTRNRWSFTRNGRTERLELDPFLRTNSVHLLRDYALADAGIVCLPTLVAADDLERGTLKPILKQHRLPGFFLCAVHPAIHQRSAKLKLFLQALELQDGMVPKWDRRLIARKLILPESRG